MKHHFKYTLYVAAVFFTACSPNPKKNEVEQQHAGIFLRGKKITNDNFTGTAYLQVMVAPDSLNATSIGNVTFEPGARTKWHSHPGGQILLVTDGVGYYQEKGAPKKILRKGDSVKCPPNIAHWHGASADTEFVQIAVTNTQNGPTVWLAAVTDAQYNSPTTNEGKSTR